jgi:hypothetical protein
MKVRDMVNADMPESIAKRLGYALTPLKYLPS